MEDKPDTDDKVKKYSFFCHREWSLSTGSGSFMIALAVLLLAFQIWLAAALLGVAFAFLWMCQFTGKATANLSDKHISLLLNQDENTVYFSDMSLGLDPFEQLHIITNSSGKRIVLSSFSQELTIDYFRLLPQNVTVGTINYPPSEKFSEHSRAAFAFDNLDSSNTLSALSARQALISLIQKDPGYFLPQEAPDIVKHWKNWLVQEFGEQIEIYSYQLERDSIVPSLYTIILPSLFLFLSYYFWLGDWGRFINGSCGFLVIAGFFLSLSRIRLLWYCKLMALAVQRWRAEHAA